jgi:hypothetical protein
MTISTKDGAASSKILAAALASGILLALPASVKADEGGVSFWTPGFFGSLAASPLTPGFSFANIYYHTSVSAGGNVAFARQVTAGNLTANFTGNLNANLNADVDLYVAIPGYTFAQPFLGGQASVVMLIPYGRNRASVDATLNGNLGRAVRVSRFRAAAPTRSMEWAIWCRSSTCAGIMACTIT